MCTYKIAVYVDYHDLVAYTENKQTFVISLQTFNAPFELLTYMY